MANNPYQRRNKLGFGISLKLNHQGQLIVAAPKLIPRFILDQLVDQHQSWIDKQKKRLKKQQPMLGKNFVYLFGKRYQLRVADLHQAVGGFFIIDDELVYQPPSGLTIIKKNQLPPKLKLEKFLKNSAINYLAPRTHQLAEKMNLKFSRIVFKQQKTRWGSCSSQKNLNFNWRLVHFPPPVIDYVIIHELAHLVHLNHSARFWALVAKFDGKYKQHKKILRQAALD